MNKFYSIGISLALLNPCFAADLQSDPIFRYENFSTSNLQNQVNFSLAVDTSLLKELEEDISLISQLKNRKSYDSQEENKEDDNTNEPIIQLTRLANKQEKDVSDNPSTEQAKAKDAQAQRKKGSRKKHVVFSTEKQLPQEKRNFSEHLSTSKKNTPSSRQDKHPLPVEDSISINDEKQLSEAQNNTQDRRKELKIQKPAERKGEYSVPSARTEKSLIPKNQTSSEELSAIENAKKQTDSQNQNANRKEPVSANPSQKQSNNKEASSTYDRHISRQNHHSVPKDTSNNSSTEEVIGGKSNARVTQSEKQKSIDSGQENSTGNTQAPQERDDPRVLGAIEPSQTESPQSEPQKLQDSSSPQVYHEKCQTPFHVMHVGLRHTEARGVGYEDGYTTLEGFGIYNNNTDFMPFIDLRGHVFDNGKLAGNVGLGGRTFFPSFEHVLGYYLYYDVRQDRHHLTPQQLGPGIELLGKRMEYRVNGYFPVGNRKSHKYHFDFDEFDGHHILLKAKQRHVLTGGDAEVGAHITQSTKYDLYAGAGPYYFSSSHASSWGGKVRVLGRFKEYVSLEVAYSYDHLFRSVIQGTVAINLPFGKRIQRKGNDCSSQINLALARAAFSPYRFEIPVVKKVSRKEAAINPATDNPWVVWFVDNTSSSNGTFESPFPTLVQAQNASSPNDMIYVFPGNGTSTGMNMGITLKDGQQLFGSGIAHRIKTEQGKITIPAFSQTSPLITNTSGNVVTLANGNQVSGMNILVTAASARGILGLSANGATISNNTIIGNADYAGIDIHGFGSVNIKNNQVINLLNPSLSTGSGIVALVQDGMFMKANISNNFTSGFINGIAFGPITNPTTAQADATIANNLITNFHNDGIFYSTGMPNSTVRILGNTVNNTVGVTGGARAGISVSVNNAPDSGTVLIQNNTVITTSPNPNTIGILSEINGGPTHLTVDIDNNRVTTGSGAGSTGINVRTTVNNVTMCATITDNIMTHQAAGTNDLQITGVGAINVDDISGNIATDVLISGNVNFVPEGSCE